MTETVQQRLQAVQGLIPEIDPTLMLLAKDLHSIASLGLPHDRRLLGMDLDNLLEGISRAGRMHAQGLDPIELQAAIVDLTALAADMHKRAVKTIRSEAGSIALHASVAARHVEDEPQDLTQEYRILAATPAPHSASRPGMVVPNPHRGSGTSFGRITGNAWMLASPQRPTAVPIDGVLLPPFCVAHLAEGDRVTLYTEGHIEGDVFTPPTHAGAIIPLVVEAGPGGAVLHGPAVLSPSDIPAGLLPQAQSAAHAYAGVRDLVAQHGEKEDAIVSYFTAVPAIPAAMATIYAFAQDSTMYWNAGESGLGFSIAATGLCIIAVSTFAAAGGLIFSYPFLMKRRWAYQDKMVNALPESHREQPWLSAAQAWLTTQGAAPEHLHAARPRSLNGRHTDVPKGLTDIVSLSETRGYNLLPANAIITTHPDLLRVLQPLPALPAPTPTDAPSAQVLAFRERTAT